MEVINRFEDDYRWLSNFWPCRVRLWGKEYDCVEKAYVAAKTTDEELREQIRLFKTPGEAKRYGRKIKLREDWDEIKVTIMATLVRRKFYNNADLGEKLLDTGIAIIVEGNTWGDTFWGVCNGKGENRLGRILMMVRDDLREFREERE